MKTLRFSIRWLALAATTLLAGTLSAQAAARLLPFQGRLSDANGAAVPDGARVVQFKIYDAPVGGRAVWNGEVQKLTINAGLVSTILGTKASLSGVDFNQDLYLEITIDANGDGQISLADPPLLPRQSILPAVFAYESANARLLDGYDWSPLFGTNNPADGTFLVSKIADGSLTSSKISDNAVTTAKIADAAVTLSKLDTNGALAGQSLTFNGANAVWSEVNAVNAALLNGFDWSAIFSGGNPQSGSMSVANVGSRGYLSADGNLNVSGRTFLTGPSTTISGSLFAPTLGGSMSLNEWSLFLRGSSSSDFSHYLKYGNAYGGASGLDGPVLVGNGSGVLGAGGTWCLRWNAGGTVNTHFAISVTSDRNMKENFTEVDASQVLNKVLALPITRWKYKGDPTAQHVGPMAQDFRAAFGLGSDDTSIATVDADGVALTAIQGLNKKLEEGATELRALLKTQQEQIETLRADLTALKGAQE